MPRRWIDDRWHLDGRPIHAGCQMEIRWADGTWEAVRIETGNHGRTLYAYSEHHGQEFCIVVDEWKELRWPAR